MSVQWAALAAGPMLQLEPSSLLIASISQQELANPQDQDKYPFHFDPPFRARHKRRGRHKRVIKDEEEEEEGSKESWSFLVNDSSRWNSPDQFYRDYLNFNQRNPPSTTTTTTTSTTTMHKNNRPVRTSINQQSVNGLLSLLLLFAISTCGCIGSIFIMSTLTVIESLQTRGNCFLVSLTLAHLLVSLLVIPSSALQIMSGGSAKASSTILPSSSMMMMTATNKSHHASVTPPLPSVQLDPAASQATTTTNDLCHYQWLALEFTLVVSQLSFMLMAVDNYLGYGASERLTTERLRSDASHASSSSSSSLSSTAAATANNIQTDASTGSALSLGRQRATAHLMSKQSTFMSHVAASRSRQLAAGSSNNNNSSKQAEKDLKGGEQEGSKKNEMVAVAGSNVATDASSTADNAAIRIEAESRKQKPSRLREESLATQICYVWDQLLQIAKRFLCFEQVSATTTSLTDNVADRRHYQNPNYCCFAGACFDKTSLAAVSTRAGSKGYATTLSETRNNKLLFQAGTAFPAQSDCDAAIEPRRRNCFGTSVEANENELHGRSISRYESIGCVSYRNCCGRLRVLLWICLIWALALANTLHRHNGNAFGSKFCSNSASGSTFLPQSSASLVEPSMKPPITSYGEASRRVRSRQAQPEVSFYPREKHMPSDAQQQARFGADSRELRSTKLEAGRYPIYQPFDDNLQRMNRRALAPSSAATMPSMTTTTTTQTSRLDVPEFLFSTENGSALQQLSNGSKDDEPAPLQRRARRLPRAQEDNPNEIYMNHLATKAGSERVSSSSSTEQLKPASSSQMMRRQKATAGVRLVETGSERTTTTSDVKTKSEEDLCQKRTDSSACEKERRPIRKRLGRSSKDKDRFFGFASSTLDAENRFAQTHFRSITNSESLDPVQQLISASELKLGQVHERKSAVRRHFRADHLSSRGSELEAPRVDRDAHIKLESSSKEQASGARLESRLIVFTGTVSANECQPGPKKDNCKKSDIDAPLICMSCHRNRTAATTANAKWQCIEDKSPGECRKSKGKLVQRYLRMTNRRHLRRMCSMQSRALLHGNSVDSELLLSFLLDQDDYNHDDDDTFAKNSTLSVVFLIQPGVIVQEQTIPVLMNNDNNNNNLNSYGNDNNNNNKSYHSNSSNGMQMKHPSPAIGKEVSSSATNTLELARRHDYATGSQLSATPDGASLASVYSVAEAVAVAVAVDQLSQRDIGLIGSEKEDGFLLALKLSSKTTQLSHGSIEEAIEETEKKDPRGTNEANVANGSGETRKKRQESMPSDESSPMSSGSMDVVVVNVGERSEKDTKNDTDTLDNTLQLGSAANVIGNGSGAGSIDDDGRHQKHDLDAEQVAVLVVLEQRKRLKHLPYERKSFSIRCDGRYEPSRRRRIRQTDGNDIGVDSANWKKTKSTAKQSSNVKEEALKGFVVGSSAPMSIQQPDIGFYYSSLFITVLGPILIASLLFMRAYLRMKTFKMRPYKPMPVAALSAFQFDDTALMANSPLPVIAQRQVFTFEPESYSQKRHSSECAVANRLSKNDTPTKTPKSTHQLATVSAAIAKHNNSNNNNNPVTKSDAAEKWSPKQVSMDRLQEESAAKFRRRSDQISTVVSSTDTLIIGQQRTASGWSRHAYSRQTLAAAPSRCVTRSQLRQGSGNVSSPLHHPQLDLQNCAGKQTRASAGSRHSAPPSANLVSYEQSARQFASDNLIETSGETSVCCDSREPLEDPSQHPPSKPMLAEKQASTMTDMNAATDNANSSDNRRQQQQQQPRKHPYEFQRHQFHAQSFHYGSNSTPASTTAATRYHRQVDYQPRSMAVDFRAHSQHQQQQHYAIVEQQQQQQQHRAASVHHWSLPATTTSVQALDDSGKPMIAHWRACSPSDGAIWAPNRDLNQYSITDPSSYYEAALGEPPHTPAANWRTQPHLASASTANAATSGGSTLDPSEGVPPTPAPTPVYPMRAALVAQSSALGRLPDDIICRQDVVQQQQQQLQSSSPIDQHPHQLHFQFQRQQQRHTYYNNGHGSLFLERHRSLPHSSRLQHRSDASGRRLPHLSIGQRQLNNYAQTGEPIIADADPPTIDTTGRQSTAVAEALANVIRSIDETTGDEGADKSPSASRQVADDDLTGRDTLAVESSNEAASIQDDEDEEARDSCVEQWAVDDDNKSKERNDEEGDKKIGCSCGDIGAGNNQSNRYKAQTNLRNKLILCTYSYMTDDQLLKSNIIVFIVNVTLWLPFILISIASQYRETFSNELRDTVWWFSALNCCSCSYIYALTNRDFRDAFNKLFYYCCCKSHVTFQRKTPVYRRQLDVDSDGNLRVHIIPGLNVYSNKLIGQTRVSGCGGSNPPTVASTPLPASVFSPTFPRSPTVVATAAVAGKSLITSGQHTGNPTVAATGEKQHTANMGAQWVQQSDNRALVVAANRQQAPTSHIGFNQRPHGSHRYYHQSRGSQASLKFGSAAPTSGASSRRQTATDDATTSAARSRKTFGFGGPLFGQQHDQNNHNHNHYQRSNNNNNNLQHL